MVRAGRVFSEKLLVRVGVPQGTVLGPILFILYLNSLLNLPIQGSIISYADDTALIFSGQDWDQVRENMTKGVRVVKNWLETNRLTLNVKKTNYIAFSITKKSRPDYNSIYVGKDQISEVTQTKYLGLNIDQHLKWTSHIEYISNKIRKLIHGFYCWREMLCKKSLIIIYKSFVESLIRYGILVWGGTYNNALYKLNITQKFILKVMFRKSRLYPSDLLWSEQIFDVRSIYISVACTYMHSHESMKKPVNHSYSTRNMTNKNMIIPVSHRTINLKYLTYLAPKMYNLLPNSVKDISDRKKFSKACNNFIYHNHDLFKDLF